MIGRNGMVKAMNITTGFQEKTALRVEDTRLIKATVYPMQAEPEREEIK